MEVYEIAPGGQHGIDPAVAYDTVSAEPLMNVYETLVGYNGSSGNSYIPEIATCVPGTAQCTADYGTNLVVDGTGALAGEPEYYTFVIDPAAHFYNPGVGGSTPTSWGVYPSDVVYSLARDMAWADLPAETATAGWIVAQALLPAGQVGFDVDAATGAGTHYPLNNTPLNIMSSMLINDSTYCPAAAMTADGHGCITFVADGQGTDWPAFLDYVADPMGASIVPCGWYSYIGATIPGWATPAANATHGDDSCMLPGGTDNTQSGAWTTYLQSIGLGKTGATAVTDAELWDAYENLIVSNYATSNPQPPVNDTAVGSGPYYMGNPTSPGYDPRLTGYELTYNPAYGQPSGCNPSNSIGVVATYGGCMPAPIGSPGSYIGNVSVTYTAGSPSSDAATQAAYQSSEIDFGGFEPSDTSMLIAGAADGYLNYIVAPSISNFFLPLNLLWSSSNYVAEGYGAAPNVPASFLTDIAVRNFLVDSFPYGTYFSSLEKVLGVEYQYAAGGPIPYGMGATATDPAGYYPTAVQYPGDPDPATDTATNPVNVTTSPTSYGYWWLHGRTIGDPDYSAALAACTHTSPCTMTFVGELGAGALNTALQDWAASISKYTNGAMSVSFEAVSFSTLLSDALVLPGQNPFTVWNLGWAPDYELPLDYLLAEVLPAGLYPVSDAVGQQLDSFETPTNSATCAALVGGVGNLAPSSVAGLTYWSSNEIPNACQGYAYDTANYFTNAANGYTSAGGAVGVGQYPTYNATVAVYNSLALYVWNGQANEVVTFAPWINASSINTNPMQGGGNDQLWYQIKYASVTPVTFVETGLPTNAEWAVKAGFGGSGVGDLATVAGPGLAFGSTELDFNLSVGKQAFSAEVVAQANPSAPYTYAGSSVASPLTVVKNVPQTVTLTFAPATTASFSATGLNTSMFTNQPWSLTLTSTLGAKGPTPFSGSGAEQASPATASVISDPNIAAGSYKYAITIPTGYIICASTHQCASPGTIHAASGTVTVPSGGLSETLVFVQVYEKVTVKITGLPSGDEWFVNWTNYTPTATTIVASESMFAPAHGADQIVFYVQQNKTGVFAFTVNTVLDETGYLPSIATGYFTGAGAVTISVTAIDPAHHHVSAHFAPEGLARKAE